MNAFIGRFTCSLLARSEAPDVVVIVVVKATPERGSAAAEAVADDLARNSSEYMLLAHTTHASGHKTATNFNIDKSLATTRPQSFFNITSTDNGCRLMADSLIQPAGPASTFTFPFR